MALVKFVPNQIEAKGKGMLNTFFVQKKNADDRSFQLQSIDGF
jgi:hypothetical protein